MAQEARHRAMFFLPGARLPDHGFQAIRLHGQGPFFEASGSPHHQLCDRQRLRQHMPLRRRIARHDRRDQGCVRDGRPRILRGPQHRDPQRPHRRIHDARCQPGAREGDPRGPRPGWRRRHQLPHGGRAAPPQHRMHLGGQGKHGGDGHPVRSGRHRQGCRLRGLLRRSGGHRPRRSQEVERRGRRLRGGRLRLRRGEGIQALQRQRVHGHGVRDRMHAVLRRRVLRRRLRGQCRGRRISHYRDERRLRVRPGQLRCARDVQARPPRRGVLPRRGDPRFQGQDRKAAIAAS